MLGGEGSVRGRRALNGGMMEESSLSGKGMRSQVDRPSTKKAHAPFRPLSAPVLDGIRGFAAMMVVWEHSQTHFDQSVGLTTFNKSGYIAVRIFFALSAFLVTYRSLLDWYTFVEDPDVVWNWQLHSGSRPANGRHKEDGAPYGLLSNDDRHHRRRLWADWFNRSFLGRLLQKPAIKASALYLYNVLSRTPDHCREFWAHAIYGRASRIWLSYITRRLLRIYPPFIATLLALYTIESWADAYWYLINGANIWKYIFLQNAEFIFWSIRPEIQYYFLVPLIVMSYQVCEHFGKRLGPKSKTWPWGSVLGRLLFIVIMFRLRAPTMENYWNKHKGKLESQAAHFLMGSVVAILWFELERRGWVPLDDGEEEARLMQRKEDSRLWQRRMNFAIRLGADAMCYYICWKIISCMPRYAAKLYGTDPKFDEGMDYEIRWGGLLYAGLIFFSLLARPSSTFPRLASWSLLRFFGRISFVVYLLHPVIIYNVNHFYYWRDFVGPIGATRVEIEVRENRYHGFDPYHDAANAKLDATFLSFLSCLIFGYLAHLVVEKPSMALSRRLCHRYFKKA